MSKSFATAAFAAALALALSATTAHGQKALVYCPVSVDAGGCDRIVSALKSKFADSVDRGFDGSSGTVDLRKIDLQHYAVFVVPSLADDATKQPYAVLRSAATRLHMAINGRVAVYSGAPDQGAANRADKDALIQNLVRWAADGHNRATGLVGLVAFLDLSEQSADRYSWVRSISTVDVSADEELQAFGDITPVTTRGGDMFSSGGRAVKFSNMASYGLHIGGHAAARTEVSAMGGASSRQSILVQYSNAGDDVKATSGGSTGKVGSSGASFNISSGMSASMSTTSTTSGPTLATDKPDYLPGDTVLFSGTGWVAGDTVTITIHEDPQWTTEDRTVTAVADGTGNFTNHTFVVDQRDYGVTFTATAVANPSGLVAQTTFTDGNKISFSSTRLGVEQTTWPTTVVAGACTSIWVQVRQGNSNFDSTRAGVQNVALSSTSGATFHSAPSCDAGSAVTTVAIPATSPATQFWFKASVSTTLNGDGGFTGNNNNATTTVTVSGPLATTTALALTTGTNPSVYGTAVTFTATVTATGGNPSGVGTVTFTDGATTLCSAVPLIAGGNTATCSPAASAFGAAAHSIVASYSGTNSGSPQFGTSASSALAQTVTAKPLTVTGITASNKPYDATTTATLNTASATLVGVVGADAVTLVTSGASGAFADVNVGTGKTVTVSGLTLSGAAIGNYTLTQPTTTADITPRPVTVTADPQTKGYGTADPTLTYKITSGSLVGSDAFSGALARDAGESVGTYAIKQGTLALTTNYALTYVGANLTITPKAITVTADAKTKTYGDADPALSYVPSPALNSGDSFTGALTRVAGENVGTYAIQQGTLSAGTNYTITYVGANLTIGTRPVTVTADAQTKSYGDPDPALTYKVTSGSLVTGDVFTGSLTRDAGTNVGTYAIKQGNLALTTNYALTYVGANLTITARPITVTADPQTKIYGAVDPTLTYQVTSGSLVAPDVFSGSLTRSAGEAVGVYAITQGTLALSTNYALTFVSKNLTITTRPITVTADAKTKVYGDVDPALSYQITTGSLVTGDAFTGSLTRAAGTSVGSYAITQGTLALNANYALTYIGANLSITPRPIGVTADAKSKVYGDPDPALTYQVTSGSLVTGDAFSGSLNRVTGENVGTYAIQKNTLTAGPNYTLSYIGANLTITAKPITVTADAKTKVYGDADPSLTYLVTNGGLIEGDSFSGSLTRAAGVNVGTYAIQQGSLTAGTNYTLTYIGANLTITPRPITVTADAKTKVYGEADPALTYQVTTGSLVGGDSFAGGLARAAGTAVGTYAINQGNLSPGGNYTLTYIGANLTITPRPITVTADAKTKIYGDADPALTAQVTSGSLAYSDALSGSLTRNAGENVGTYAILQGTLSAGTNYTLTYAGASLTITPRPVTVAADPQSKFYGDADPALTYHVSVGSLVSGDAFSGALTRDAGENVGTYAITKGTLVLSTNYTLTYSGASLTINKRPVTITADAKSKVFGEADPTLTYQITSGSLVNSDAFSGALVRDAGENVGTYAIRQGSVILSANYALTFAGANLTITQRPIAVTADAKTKVYGDPDPALTYHVTSGSLVSPDVFTGSLSRAPSEHVGSWAITQGTLALTTNYALTFISNNLSITPRPITVTADAKTKVYGDADPALTYQLTTGSLVTGDAFSGNLTRAAGANVGTYAITQGTLTAGTDYTLTYVGANLAITQRPITVTADAETKVYGDGDPTLTFKVTSGNLVGSDAISGSLTRAAGEAVPGPYAIQKGTISAGDNYNLTYVGAGLSVTPRSVTVTPQAPDLIWNGSAQSPNYSLTVTVGSLGNSDAITVLGSPIYSPSTVTNVGTYASTVSGLANNNYTISTSQGTVNVLDKTAPLATITQLNPVPLNTAGTLNVNINDVTTGNSKIIAWKFSVNGTYGAEIPVPAGSQAPNVDVSSSLPPSATSDVIQVCVVGEDAGGNWSKEVCSLLAVYDPSAGFVTGGGWIMSPAGAYVANTSLTGRANFGFVSKYQKGANVPTGNTEFQFQEANLNFHSTSFAWLVISGTTQAQFKGTGTINGSGTYNFLVTAIDGDNFNGTKKPDGFRIKITDAAGNVVYDNQMGADDTSTATTTISGGSIQIQSK